MVAVLITKEEVGGRKVSLSHSVHKFMHSFSKQFLKSCYMRNTVKVGMFYLWPLMTILTVVLMVLVDLVEAPIKKSVIFLLVGASFLQPLLCCSDGSGEGGAMPAVRGRSCLGWLSS